jgi:hypothetical protein
MQHFSQHARQSIAPLLQGSPGSTACHNALVTAASQGRKAEGGSRAASLSRRAGLLCLPSPRMSSTTAAIDDSWAASSAQHVVGPASAAGLNVSPKRPVPGSTDASTEQLGVSNRALYCLRQTRRKVQSKTALRHKQERLLVNCRPKLECCGRAGATGVGGRHPTCTKRFAGLHSDHRVRERLFLPWLSGLATWRRCLA